MPNFWHKNYEILPPDSEEGEYVLTNIPRSKKQPNHGNKSKKTTISNFTCHSKTDPDYTPPYMCNRNRNQNSDIIRTRRNTINKKETMDWKLRRLPIVLLYRAEVLYYYVPEENKYIVEKGKRFSPDNNNSFKFKVKLEKIENKATSSVCNISESTKMLNGEFTNSNVIVATKQKKLVNKSPIKCEVKKNNNSGKQIKKRKYVPKKDKKPAKKDTKIKKTSTKKSKKVKENAIKTENEKELPPEDNLIDANTKIESKTDKILVVHNKELRDSFHLGNNILVAASDVSAGEKKHCSSDKKEVKNEKCVSEVKTSTKNKPKVMIPVVEKIKITNPKHYLEKNTPNKKELNGCSKIKIPTDIIKKNEAADGSSLNNLKELPKKDLSPQVHSSITAQIDGLAKRNVNVIGLNERIKNNAFEMGCDEKPNNSLLIKTVNDKNIPEIKETSETFNEKPNNSLVTRTVNHENLPEIKEKSKTCNKEPTNSFTITPVNDIDPPEIKKTSKTCNEKPNNSLLESTDKNVPEIKETSKPFNETPNNSFTITPVNDIDPPEIKETSETFNEKPNNSLVTRAVNDKNVPEINETSETFNEKPNYSLVMRTVNNINPQEIKEKSDTVDEKSNNSLVMRTVNDKNLPEIKETSKSLTNINKTSSAIKNSPKDVCLKLPKDINITPLKKTDTSIVISRPKNTVHEALKLIKKNSEISIIPVSNETNIVPIRSEKANVTVSLIKNEGMRSNLSISSIDNAKESLEDDIFLHIDRDVKVYPDTMPIGNFENGELELNNTEDGEIVYQDFCLNIPVEKEEPNISDTEFDTVDENNTINFNSSEYLPYEQILPEITDEIEILNEIEVTPRKHFYNCSECGRTEFNTMKSVYCHWKKIHKIFPKYQCDICCKLDIQISLKTLYKHYNKRHKADALKIWRQMQLLKDEKKYFKKCEIYICIECNLNFPTFNNYQLHLAEYHESFLKCKQDIYNGLNLEILPININFELNIPNQKRVLIKDGKKLLDDGTEMSPANNLDMNEMYIKQEIKTENCAIEKEEIMEKLDSPEISKTCNDVFQSVDIIPGDLVEGQKKNVKDSNVTKECSVVLNQKQSLSCETNKDVTPINKKNCQPDLINQKKENINEKMITEESVELDTEENTLKECDEGISISKTGVAIHMSCVDITEEDDSCSEFDQHHCSDSPQSTLIKDQCNINEHSTNHDNLKISAVNNCTEFSKTVNNDIDGELSSKHVAVVENMDHPANEIEFNGKECIPIEHGNNDIPVNKTEAIVEEPNKTHVENENILHIDSSDAKKSVFNGIHIPDVVSKDCEEAKSYPLLLSKTKHFNEKQTKEKCLVFFIYKVNKKYSSLNTNYSKVESFVPDQKLVTYACGHCDNSSKDHKTVERHIRRSHQKLEFKFHLESLYKNLVYFTCHLCPLTVFYSYWDFLSHSEDCHRSLGNYFVTNTPIGSYIFTSANFVYHTFTLDIFQNNLSFNLKRISVYTELLLKGFQCDDCNRFFTDKFSLKNHILKEHIAADKLTKITPKYKCNFCYSSSVSFYKKIDLLFHMEIEHDAETIRDKFLTTCNSEEIDSKAYDFVQKIKQAMDCELCLKVFYSRKDLKKHFYTTHFPSVTPTPVVVEKTFSCKFCDEKFVSQKEALDHRDEEHGTRLVKRTMGNFKRNVENMKEYDEHEQKYFYYCDFCQKRFDFNGELAIHIQSHLKIQVRPKCQKCSITFMSMDECTTHFEANHNWNIPSKTQESEIDNLVEKQEYRCCHCRDVLTSLSEFHYHLRSYHGVYDSWKICNKCDFKALENSTLQEHKLLVHPPPVPPPSVKRRRSSYYESDEDMLICDFCQAEFGSKKRMTTHIMLKHLSLSVHKNKKGRSFTVLTKYQYHLRLTSAERKLLHIEYPIVATFKNDPDKFPQVLEEISFVKSNSKIRFFPTNNPPSDIVSGDKQEASCFTVKKTHSPKVGKTPGKIVQNMSSNDKLTQTRGKFNSKTVKMEFQEGETFDSKRTVACQVGPERHFGVSRKVGIKFLSKYTQTIKRLDLNRGEAEKESMEAYAAVKESSEKQRSVETQAQIGVVVPRNYKETKSPVKKKNFTNSNPVNQSPQNHLTKPIKKKSFAKQKNKSVTHTEIQTVQSVSTAVQTNKTFTQNQYKSLLVQPKINQSQGNSSQLYCQSDTSNQFYQQQAVSYQNPFDAWTGSQSETLNKPNWQENPQFQNYQTWPQNQLWPVQQEVCEQSQMQLTTYQDTTMLQNQASTSQQQTFVLPLPTESFVCPQQSDMIAPFTNLTEQAQHSNMVAPFTNLYDQSQHSHMVAPFSNLTEQPNNDYQPSNSDDVRELTQMLEMIKDWNPDDPQESIESTSVQFNNTYISNNEPWRCNIKTSYKAGPPTSATLEKPVKIDVPKKPHINHLTGLPQLKRRGRPPKSLQKSAKVTKITKTEKMVKTENKQLAKEENTNLDDTTTNSKLGYANYLYNMLCEGPYVCSVCETACDTEEALKFHEQSQHNSVIQVNTHVSTATNQDTCAIMQSFSTELFGTDCN